MLDLRFARKDIEKLYIDTCSIYEFQKVTDPETHITNMQEVLVHENVPCKISHKTTAYSEAGISSVLTLASSLIINPDIVIAPGSKILVTRDGVTTAYKNSSEPARYINYQKVMLELEDERA